MTLGFQKYDALEDLKERANRIDRDLRRESASKHSASFLVLMHEGEAVGKVAEQETARRRLGFESRTKSEIEAALAILDNEEGEHLEKMRRLAELERAVDAERDPAEKRRLLSEMNRQIEAMETPAEARERTAKKSAETEDAKKTAEFTAGLPGVYRSPEGGVLTIRADGSFSFQPNAGATTTFGEIHASRLACIYRSEEAQLLGKLASRSYAELEANFDEEVFAFTARFSGDRKTELTVLWWIGIDEHRGTFRK